LREFHSVVEQRESREIGGRANREDMCIVAS